MTPITRIRIRSIGQILSVSALALLAGCTENDGDRFDESDESEYVRLSDTSLSTERMNQDSSKSIDVALLDPETLAHREVEFGNHSDEENYDELVERYRSQLSFRVRLQVEDAEVGGGLAGRRNDLWESGDVRNAFRLESNDTVLYPLHVQEERQGKSDERVWHLVFARPPRRSGHGDRPLSLIYDGMNDPADSFRVNYTVASTSY